MSYKLLFLLYFWFIMVGENENYVSVAFLIS